MYTYIFLQSVLEILLCLSWDPTYVYVKWKSVEAEEIHAKRKTDNVNDTNIKMKENKEIDNDRNTVNKNRWE